jgi:hypothetical protein
MDKGNVIKLITNNLPLDALSTGYKEKCMKGTVNTKFHG